MQVTVPGELHWGSPHPSHMGAGDNIGLLVHALEVARLHWVHRAQRPKKLEVLLITPFTIISQLVKVLGSRVFFA